MSAEYQNTTNEQIARQAEAELNDHKMSGHKPSTRDPKYGSDSGMLDRYRSPLPASTFADVYAHGSCAAYESGVDASAAQRFPGGDVRYGTAAAGGNNNQDIPVEEGGDILQDQKRYVLVSIFWPFFVDATDALSLPSCYNAPLLTLCPSSRFTKARDFEGPGGPETKEQIRLNQQPGADDIRSNVRS